MKLIAKERGVSLIELMISVALGLFLTSGILYLFLGSKTTHTTQGGVANVQESLRFAQEYIAFDIRMAGYMGCGNIRDMAAPAIIAKAPVPPLGLGNSVRGFNNGTGWTNPTATNPVPIPRVEGTDVISLYRASLNSINLSQNSDGSNFKIATNPYPLDWTDGKLMIITDCLRSDIFRGTFSNNTSPVTVTHAAGINSQPKLITESPPNGNYGNDAQLASLESWDYFIGINPDIIANPNRNPSLYRASITTTNLAGENVAEELVEGIDDLQIEYGLDTIADDNYVADSYTTTGTTANWEQVVSVRITLRARSSEDGALPMAATYAYNGANMSDRRYRQSHTSVIGLRNLVQ